MINQITDHPAIRYSQEMAAICRPLKKLDISYFAHVRITQGKKFSALASNPLFAEHYLRNQYYTADIHMIDETKVGNYIVWDAIEFTGIGEKMCMEAHHFGIHNPFTIIHKNKDSIDYFHFANDSVSKHINQIYLANVDLLNRFIDYFKEAVKQSKLLSYAYQLTFDIDLPHKIVMTHFGDTSMVCDQAEFFRDISVSKKLQIQNVSLSKRQSEILRLVVYGKTIKEISQTLGLSPRTTGHYFETIKTKFNVYTKSELIAKTVDTQYIKFL